MGDTLRLVFNICPSSPKVTKLQPLGNLPKVELELTRHPYPQNGLYCPGSYAFHWVVMSHILSSISFCVCVHAHMCVRSRIGVLLGCMSYFCCCCCWRSFPVCLSPFPAVIHILRYDLCFMRILKRARGPHPSGAAQLRLSVLC